MIRYILTGAPGAGKSSVIQSLSQLGYATTPEAATDYIAQQQAQGILRPWEEPSFLDALLELQSFRQSQRIDHSHSLLQFFDRSPICTYALALYLEQKPSIKLINAIHKVREAQFYQPQVFFFQNLGFITPTEARQISFAEALRFEQIHLEAYSHFGYRCILIPAEPLEQRVQTILQHCQVFAPK